MVYLIFYDFLYPMLGIQITTLVSALAKNDDQWRNLFALQSVKLSEVFTIFVIHQAVFEKWFGFSCSIEIPLIEN